MGRYFRNSPRSSPSSRTARLGRGDVLAMMDPDTWRSGIAVLWATPFNYTMWAAFAALAACARVTLFAASRFTLKQYEDRELTVRNATGPSYPVILLPVAVAAVERYLELRRPLGGSALFVREDGRRLDVGDAPRAFGQLARRHELSGARLHEELYAFYDRCFLRETDRAAVVALKHFRSGVNRDVSRADISAACRDPDRLEKVLGRRHPLAGEPGKWLGGHGKAKIAREMRIFWPVRRNKVSEFMRTDPVCALLLDLEWSGGYASMEKLRKRLVQEHLAYLSSLAQQGLLTNRQIGHMLNCVAEVAGRLRRDLKRKSETPAQREARERLEQDWEARIPAMYRAGGGETGKAFFAGSGRRRPATRSLGRSCCTLHRAGIAPPRTGPSKGRRPEQSVRKVQKRGGPGQAKMAKRHASG